MARAARLARAHARFGAVAAAEAGVAHAGAVGCARSAPAAGIRAVGAVGLLAQKSLVALFTGATAGNLRGRALAADVDAHLLGDGRVLRGAAVRVEDAHAAGHVHSLRLAAVALSVAHAEALAADGRLVIIRELRAALAGETGVAEARAEQKRVDALMRGVRHHAPPAAPAVAGTVVGIGAIAARVALLALANAATGGFDACSVAGALAVLIGGTAGQNDRWKHSGYPMAHFA